MVPDNDNSTSASEENIIMKLRIMKGAGTGKKKGQNNLHIFFLKKKHENEEMESGKNEEKKKR